MFGYIHDPADAIVGCFLLWLAYCALMSICHGPDKGVKVIKATGRYSPVRLLMRVSVRLTRWWQSGK